MELSGAAWRKSSYSGTQTNCVEVAFVWRKSSHSGSQSNCVEVAEVDHAVAVRDSKDPAGPALAFGRDDWSAFLALLKQGSPSR